MNLKGVADIFGKLIWIIMAPNYDNIFAFLDTTFDPQIFEAIAKEYSWNKPALNDEVLRQIEEDIINVNGTTGYTGSRQIGVLKSRYDVIMI